MHPDDRPARAGDGAAISQRTLLRSGAGALAAAYSLDAIPAWAARGRGVRIDEAAIRRLFAQTAKSLIAPGAFMLLRARRRAVGGRGSPGGSAGAGANCSGSIPDDGHDIAFPTRGGCPATFGKRDPMLDPAGLASNGGPTKTIALQAWSAAIDQVPATGAGCPATDCLRGAVAGRSTLLARRPFAAAPAGASSAAAPAGAAAHRARPQSSPESLGWGPPPSRRGS